MDSSFMVSCQKDVTVAFRDSVVIEIMNFDLGLRLEVSRPCTYIAIDEKEEGRKEKEELE